VTRHTKGIFDKKKTQLLRENMKKRILIGKVLALFYTFSLYIYLFYSCLTLVECKMHIPSNYISCFPLAQKNHLFASIALVWKASSFEVKNRGLLI